MSFITEAALENECNRLIRRFEHYAREMRNDDERRRRRVATPYVANVLRPEYWNLRDFNPYLVRANAPAITRAINLALRNRDYRPRPAVGHLVPKGDGSFREVSVFPVADSLVSRNVYLSLNSKNRALMSARSYAYRSDLSTHDAIQYISSEFETSERIFLAEYDFSKFFDSISHAYLWETLERNRFLIDPNERRVIEAFLENPLVPLSSYGGGTADKRTVGIPQGTSISLFLANAAAWEIDRDLERLGVGFARYADDTLIWSRDYGAINQAANVLKRMSSSIGAELNPHKSKGVRLFIRDEEPAEMEATSKVEFVGYRFSRSGIGFRDQVTARIKSRINFLIWANLLQPLQQGSFDPARVRPHVDRDYLVLIMQIRRYLYGNLSEEQVRVLQRGSIKRMHYPGILSHFPLVDDGQQLSAMDGWLVGALHMALKRRGALCRAVGVSDLPLPHGLTRERLIQAVGQTTSGVPIDLRIPSFSRFSSVLQRAAKAFGANAIAGGSGAREYEYQFVE